MPEQFFGKKVEVIVVELSEATDNKPIPPAGNKIAADKLFSNFGEAPDFPSAEEIRRKAWPSKW